MRAELMAPDVAEGLRTASFTYPEVGATLGALPPGYTHARREVTLGSGEQCLETARTALLGWHVHRLAGPRLTASSLRVQEGAVAVVQLGVGPLALPAPIRVVYCVDQPDRAGFAYGTLPGHPVRGEEAFAVYREADESVRFRIVAFSRPATRLAAGSGPLGRSVQTKLIDRYVAAMISYVRPETRRA
jgi:uncharacterized protein (UPF0548 family)